MLDKSKDKIKEEARAYTESQDFRMDFPLDEERREIINGERIDFLAAPSPRHQEVVGALHASFWSYLRGKPCSVYTSPFDVKLSDQDQYGNQILQTVQPDLLVLCDKKKIDETGCKGAPDLIIEVASPSTYKRDLSIKKGIYERCGVRHYFLVYPFEKIVAVYTLNKDGLYSDFDTFGENDHLPIHLFDDFSIDLSVIFEA